MVCRGANECAETALARSAPYPVPMTRYATLPIADLDADQQRIHDLIAAGPRGSVGGPFPALLRSPHLCERVQDLGRFVRFESSLSGPARELAILVTARHWHAQYEWYAHARLARAEGVDQTVIDAVRDDDHSPLDDGELQLVRTFATTLLSTGRVSDETHERAVAMLGERGVVELVGTIGYYCLVSLVLNAAEVAVPGDAELLPD
jgi:4-carboxymuconolactone decarboxylase